MEELVDDTAELLGHLGVTTCTFVGLSIGGMIGQGLAAARPDLVHALVLSNTAAKMGSSAMWQGRIAAIEETGLEAMADTVMERWFPAAFRESAEGQGWRHMLVRTPEAGYLGCCHALAGADLTATTATLNLPVMGIGGSDDGSSPPEVVKATVDLIPG